MKTKSIWILLFAVIFTLLSDRVFAERNGLPKFNRPGRNQPKNAPFDGSIIVLVGAGMVYAVKRAFDTKRKSITSKNGN